MLKDEENIKSENDIIEEENITEETIVETQENMEATLENVEELEKIDEVEEVQESSNEENKNKSGFLAKLGASIIDQGISLLASFVLLYLFNLILMPFGYKVGDKVSVFLVIYVIVNILYGIIMESTKLRRTIGKAILKL
ncbi:RDD family protein [uncultured Clostridium sp.]|uniref:RDD family protein n=1 Tax=uncultured Clostridium sp. TaxID=59620 RepID=UPI003217135E